MSLSLIEIEHTGSKMASRAKNKPNNKQTYASAVVGVDEKSHFAELAVCKLKAPTNMAHSHIPTLRRSSPSLLIKKALTPLRSKFFWLSTLMVLLE